MTVLPLPLDEDDGTSMDDGRWDDYVRALYQPPPAEGDEPREAPDGLSDDERVGRKPPRR